MKKQTLILIAIPVLTICFAIAFYAMGWTEPISNPPSGNISLPLNTSAVAQTKAGNLVVNALGVYATGNALLVPNGNVGIGTTTPGAKLHLTGDFSGDTADRFAIKFQNTRGTGRTYALYGGGVNSELFRLRDITAGADRITVNQNGNVGIGTTGPQAKLEVKDGGIFLNSSKQFGGIYSNSTDASGALVFPAAPGGHDGFQIFRQDPGPGQNTYCGQGGNASGCLIFNMIDRNVAPVNAHILFGTTMVNTFTPVMIIRSDTGNVGIGTTSPGAQLELSKAEAASSNPRFKLTEGNRFVQILTNALAGSWNNLVQAGDTAIIYRGATGNGSGALVIGQHSNSTRGIRIDANGNVGIGTTSPGANKLEVVGGPIKATGGLIIETRTSDPTSPATGQMWLRTDI